ncbi:ankyrin repeat-containing domain protein [Coniochaeta sp. 2T2.1]|nr:ankyrin repeat-containing domain protein [Coniochaeta sp. 2T2.1]
MAEIVAAVGAVSAFASLVDLCFQIGKSLNQMREDFADAADDFKSLQHDVEAFRSILQQIVDLLEERRKTGGEHYRRTIYEHLLSIAINCTTPLLGLKKIINKFEDYSDLEGRGWAVRIPIIKMRLRWITEQKKILKLQQSLEKQKSTINTQLLVILVTGEGQTIESPVQRIEVADIATAEAVEDIAPPSAEELTAALPVLCQTDGLPEDAPGAEAVESPAADTEPQSPQQQQQPRPTSPPPQPRSRSPNPKRIPLRLSVNNLFSAIASGDNANLLSALQRGEQLVTERASDGTTPLQAAVVHNYEEIVVTLLFFSADPNVGGGYDRSPLLAAINHERPRLVKILLEAGANPSAPGVIQAAAAKGLEMLRLCLAKYADLEYKIDIDAFHPSGPGAVNGVTPLIAACVNGNVEVARFLLEEAHADPVVMFKGDCVPKLRSALHASVVHQDEALLSLLLSFISDPNVCNDIVHGPGLLLHCAVKTGNPKILEMLLQAKVNPNLSVPIFGTALLAACKQGALDMVELLLKYNADANIPPPELHPIEEIRNPLHAAAAVGSVAMLDMLVSHGGDVRRDGGVLWVATRHARIDVMRRLLQMVGVDINETWRTPGYDVTRGMPLHCAAGIGNVELLKFLLDHRADPNVSTSWLGTPLDVAMKSKHRNCVKELLGDSN